MRVLYDQLDYLETTKLDIRFDGHSVTINGTTLCPLELIELYEFLGELLDCSEES